MKMTRFATAAVLAAALTVVLAGCKHKPPATAPTPPPPPATTRHPRRRHRRRLSAGAAASAARRQRRFSRGSRSKSSTRRSRSTDVFFDLDRADLTDEGRAALQKDADWMKKWTTTQGDRRRPLRQPRHPEYNLALGERRAPAVKDYLASLGVGSRSDADRQQGQGSAVLHGRERGVLVAEPARPLHHHGEVGKAGPGLGCQGQAQGSPCTLTLHSRP